MSEAVLDHTDVDEQEEELPPPPGERHPQESLEIPLEQIAELDNVRAAEHWDEEKVNELASSMYTQGQLEPCLVRPAAVDAEHDRPYELIFGYRRKRAAEKLGWEAIRCEVRPEEEIANVIFKMLVENIQRQEMSGLDEAKAIRALMDECGFSQAEIARQLGVNPSQISHRLTVLRLPDSIAAKLAKGEISTSLAEVVATLPDASTQEKAVELAKKHDWGVKKTQAWVREVKENVKRPAQPTAPADGEEDSAGLPTGEGAPSATEPVVGAETVDNGPPPLRTVTLADVVELPHLNVRPDLDGADVERIVVYSQLRNGMDAEMLDYLEEAYGYPYERLWDYVRELTDEQVQELKRRLAVRFVSAAHRYYALEPSLQEDLGVPLDAGEDVLAASIDAASLTLPTSPEDADWIDDWDDEDEMDELSDEDDEDENDG